MKIGLIINPRSGRGKGGRVGPHIHKLFRDSSCDILAYYTERRGHARQLAERIKNDVDIIVAAGGDGTVHEVVNGMVGGNAALGVIPVGSGNDFAKPLKMPKDLKKAVQIILENKRQKIDLGKVGNLYFPNGFGIGFDAYVVKESNSIQKLRGVLIYLYAVIKQALKYSNREMTIRVDGQVSTKDVFLIAIGNGVAMGGGFYLTPEASLTDGQFDVCIIRGLKKWEIFLHLPKVFWGGHVKMKQVEMLKTNELLIEAPGGVAAHADGELLPDESTRFEVELIPRALEVIYNAK
ncbi:MAG: diacylglycerol kinase family lipid kinase [Calditrichia bacterium]